MKKLLGIIILSLIFSSTSHAITIIGLDEVKIMIEKIDSKTEKVCNLYKEDVQNIYRDLTSLILLKCLASNG